MVLKWNEKVKIEKNYKKVQAALNICKHKTHLQLVRHLKQLVSLRLKKKKIRQTRLEQPRGCVVFFSYFKKINLKSRTWKLYEHYLNIIEDWEKNSEV